jgi:hypothetical protein
MDRDHVYETVMDQTISDSTAAQPISVAGYRRYSVLARFEGPADAAFSMEISNTITVVREELKLGPGGWLNFAKEYTVFAPDVGIVIYHPPPNLKALITVYAGL